MTQQDHIQPEEIELLLDGDEGFVVFPLRKHLEACPDCRAKLQNARAINDLIEHLPHAAPASGFADRVMARVQVFEPWHVTLVNQIRSMVPQTGPLRALSIASMGGVALSVTAIAVGLALRLDLLAYAVQLGLARLQTGAATTAGAAVSSMFGESALTSLQVAGMPAVVVGLSAVLVSIGVATLGLRSLTRARRRGN
ncbi:MAG TPA: hypothetical protein VE967_01625 [Gemmatimonadaceae bacterium]|nr:hypothetical protein [Gemmatimonadaceae bacterium]